MGFIVQGLLNKANRRSEPRHQREITVKIQRGQSDAENAG